jgi:transposase
MLESRLLSILMARGRVSARDLAAQFEVAVRTIHRNVDHSSTELAFRSMPIAAGLAADLPAVRTAFDSPWSSGGQVEGQIDRLNLLKRQMYGRAKLDLQRARVLHPN